MGKFWQLPFFWPVCVMLCLAMLTWWACNVPFFWDGVALVSKPAWHFYQNGFFPPLLPVELDAGHPPLFSLYIALCWKLFGATLPVSHWAAFPFLAGIALAFVKLTKHLALNRMWGMAMVFWVVEPCFASQSILNAGEAGLICLHLWCMERLLSGKYGQLSLLLPFLAMVSLRGMLLLPGFAVCQYLLLIQAGKHGREGLKTMMTTFIPAFLVTAGWLVYHYVHTGFFTDNTVAAHWSGNYGYAGLGGILRNIAVVAWRMADQGRIVVLLACLVMYKKLQNQHYILPQTHKRFLLVLAIQFAAFLPFAVLRQTPVMHRYFTVYYLLLGLVLLLFTEAAGIGRVKKTWLMAIATLALISGHWWIYPFPVANGWDATLACLPYFKARQEVNNYLEKNHILPDSVCSAFPMIAGSRYTHLTPDNRFQLTGKDKLPVSKARYVLYSNLSNDFTPAEVALLQQEFTLLQSFDRGIVYLRLYERNP